MDGMGACELERSEVVKGEEKGEEWMSERKT